MPSQVSRPVRVAAALAGTVVVVAPILVVAALLVRWIGVEWTAVVAVAGALLVWVAEPWWVVNDPRNPLLWLRSVSALWRWAAADELD